MTEGTFGSPLAFIWKVWYTSYMDNGDFIKLSERIEKALEGLDIHVWDASIYVYDLHDQQVDLNSVLKAIDDGQLTAFIEVDAILGDDVWEKIEAINS